MTDKPLRVLAVTAKPKSASFHHRVLDHIAPLAERGIHVETAHYKRDRAKRGKILERCKQFDAIWWHRHLINPLRIRRWRKVARRIAFDFDDPVCFTSRDGGQPSAARAFRFRQMMKRADAALPASDYLAALARPLCQNVQVIPMAVDIPEAIQARRYDQDVELLWLGSKPTQAYLKQITPALKQMAVEYPQLSLRVVAHDEMKFGPMRVTFRRWSPAEQAQALAECHVGLCPMPDSLWTRGKCPYKVLQYMAHGMAWIGSAVGENKRAVADGFRMRGLCATSDPQWVGSMARMMKDRDSMRRMGLEGRAYVSRHHDHAVIVDQLANFWRRLIKS
jgi:glycosyltransferase involved in cell wall biosynthesis